MDFSEYVVSNVSDNNLGIENEDVFELDDHYIPRSTAGYFINKSNL
jgi:hypothetical protein